MNMNKILFTMLLVAANAPIVSAATSSAVTPTKADKKDTKTEEKNTKESSMKDVKVDAEKAAPVSEATTVSVKDQFNLGFGFRMNSFIINGFDRINSTFQAGTLTKPATITRNKLEDYQILSVFPVVDLVSKFDSKYARGKITVQARLMKDNDANRVVGNATDALYIDETFVNLGTEDGLNVDVGFCDSAATYVFSSNSKYYRGPGKGIFGDAARYMIWANEITGKNAGYTDTTASKANPDKNNRTYPHNWMLLREYIAGDDWTYQPRATVWLPKLVNGAHTIEVGVGSTFTTESQDGVYFTAGGYYDYSFGEKQKVRASLAGGISAQTEDKLNSYEYKRPGGIAAGISYHSESFDVGVKFTYNHGSYAWKVNPTTLSTLKTKGNLTSNNEPVYSVNEGSQTNIYKYVEKDSSGPMTFSIRSRYALVNDWDLTAAVFTSVRNTGFVKNTASDAIYEFATGVTLGVNGPIGESNFRFGIESTGMIIENDAQALEAQARGVNTVSSIGKMATLGVGINYAG